jgi:hypothetical protein
MQVGIKTLWYTSESLSSTAAKELPKANRRAEACPPFHSTSSPRRTSLAFSIAINRLRSSATRYERRGRSTTRRRRVSSLSGCSAGRFSRRYSRAIASVLLACQAAAATLPGELPAAPGRRFGRVQTARRGDDGRQLGRGRHWRAESGNFAGIGCRHARCEILWSPIASCRALTSMCVATPDSGASSHSYLLSARSRCGQGEEDPWSLHFGDSQEHLGLGVPPSTNHLPAHLRRAACSPP